MSQESSQPAGDLTDVAQLTTESDTVDLPDSKKQKKEKANSRKKDKPSQENDNGIVSTGSVFNGPFTWLKWITAKYPYLKYSWVAVAIAICLLVSRLFSVDIRLLGIAIVFTLPMFIVYFIFDTAKNHQTKSSLKPYQHTILISGTVFWVAIAVFLITSIFFGWPIDIRSSVFDQSDRRYDFAPASNSIPINLNYSNMFTTRLRQASMPTPEQRAKSDMLRILDKMAFDQSKQPDDVTLIFLEMKNGFDRQYNSFKVSVDFEDNDRFQLLEICAFIVKLNSDDKNDMYYNLRQAPTRFGDDLVSNGNTISISKPDLGERILILVKVKQRTNTGFVTLNV